MVHIFTKNQLNKTLPGRVCGRAKKKKKWIEAHFFSAMTVLFFLPFSIPTPKPKRGKTPVMFKRHVELSIACFDTTTGGIPKDRHLLPLRSDFLPMVCEENACGIADFFFLFHVGKKINQGGAAVLVFDGLIEDSSLHDMVII
jgi:hypothetical protein